MPSILPCGDCCAHAAGALLLLDAAQTAGVVPMDMQTQGIGLLAFTGHKGLQGPPGIDRGDIVRPCGNRLGSTLQDAPLRGQLLGHLAIHEPYSR